MLSVSIFNVARYLTDSLRGPVLAHYSEADRPSLMGRVRRGTKLSFNFFILRYIKHYTHIYIFISYAYTLIVQIRV